MATVFRRRHLEPPQGKLEIEEEFPSCNNVYYIPPAHKLDAGENPEIYKTKILTVCGQDDYVSIYPIDTLSIKRKNAFGGGIQLKYKQIESITLEGFGYETADSAEDVREILEYFPAGFLKDYDFGLGLQMEYRFIIDAVEEIKSIKHLVISKKEKTSISEDGQLFTIKFSEYDAIRKQLNTISNRARSAARKIKAITAHNVLSYFLDIPEYPQKTHTTKNDTLYKLISSEEAALSKADQEVVIKIFDQNKRAMAEEQPQELIKLRNDIELVTLEELIAKYEEMLGKNLSEEKWQSLFNENPFILNLAFGYPVIKIRDQAHIGGRAISGAGEKITDYLVKNGVNNNAALIEIKTPATELLNKTAYRDNLYTASTKLAGALNQILDQKYKFQKEIATIKDNSRIYDLESYAVHGVLIIGKTPDDIDKQKSFELFRGNSKDIAIITFDELLQKLKYLHVFLSTENQRV